MYHPELADDHCIGGIGRPGLNDLAELAGVGPKSGGEHA